MLMFRQPCVQFSCKLPKLPLKDYQPNRGQINCSFTGKRQAVALIYHSSLKSHKNIVLLQCFGQDV